MRMEIPKVLTRDLTLSPHIESLVYGVQVFCSCDRCVRHLIAEVIRWCENAPLDCLPEKEEERGTAAHLRTKLGFVADGLK